MELTFKRVAEAVRRSSGGVVSPAIEACAIPHMGVGVVARERIPKDTLLFQAGRDVWFPFSAECALEQSQQKAPGFLQQLDLLLASNRTLREGSSFVPNALVLSAHLLVNFPHSQDPEAALLAMAEAPPLEEVYVNALPRFVDLPLYWNDKQFAELQGCEEARRAIQQGPRFYMQVYQHLFGSENQFVNPEAFFWAITILMSRATSGRNQPFTLIPFFDWFNHSDKGDECVQEFDPQKGFTVHTTRSYEPGEQLFINYGHHGNLRLLRNYGFTIPDNPYDSVNLSMPTQLQELSRNDPMFIEKSDLLRSATGGRGDTPAQKTIRFQHDGQLAADSEQWLEILLASPDELTALFKQAAQEPSPSSSTNPPSSLELPPTLTQKVRSEVTKIATSRLQQHASSLEEDALFLSQHDRQLAPWLRSCLHIRMGEKQTLHRVASRYA